MIRDKICFMDLETSGLKIPPAVILSIGACTNNGGEFSMLIRPTDEQWKAADPKALEVNGLTWDRLDKEGIPLADVSDFFVAWVYDTGIEKGEYSLVLQNPSFDMGFIHNTGNMRDALEFVGFPFHDTYNVMDMYRKCFNKGLVPDGKAWPNGKPKLNGKSISEGLGVTPEDDVHDALEGARVVMRNYNACVALLEEADS